MSISFGVSETPFKERFRNEINDEKKFYFRVFQTSFKERFKNDKGLIIESNTEIRSNTEIARNCPNTSGS